MYRDSCGSLRGAVDHQTAGESLCGWCLEAEAAARLRSEGIPRRLSPAPGRPQARPEPVAPVTPVQAAVNRAVLAAEVEAYEQDHPSPSTRRRKLRVVRTLAAEPRRRTA